MPYMLAAYVTICHQQRKGTHRVVLLQIAIACARNGTLPDVCHVMRSKPLSPQTC
jgi:hypothetical protein